MKSNLLFSLLILATIFASCKKDEPEAPRAFIDTLVSNYSGPLKLLDCSVPQNTSLEAGDGFANITKNSDTEVTVSLGSSGLGEFFNFNGTINSDSSFVVPTFTQDGIEYSGSGKLVDKLRVVLTDGCTFFGGEVATVVFDEN